MKSLTHPEEERNDHTYKLQNKTIPYVRQSISDEIHRNLCFHKEGPACLHNADQDRMFAFRIPCRRVDDRYLSAERREK